MHTIHRRLGFIGFAGALASLLVLQAQGTDAPIKLNLDARDASRLILHAKLSIPAEPGPLTLVYPKWIPGEHGPTGPISDLAGLKMSASGKSVAWRRDPSDYYAFNVEVPSGADTLEVRLDFLVPPNAAGFTSAASCSPTLAVISWNTVILYPMGTAARQVQVAPQIQLPPKWKFATALSRVPGQDDQVEFEAVSLETLVDSPLIAGAHLRVINLSPSEGTPHRLNIVADSAAALEIKPADTEKFSNLVQEANALFGARHYGKYDFLLTLSEQVAHFGMEHHDSSDNRVPERMLTDDALLNAWVGLLPHEMVHSWNGKYRRPIGLATSDFQEPMQTELLWIYEGLTTYLGDILTARSGFWSKTNYLDYLAFTAAQMEHQSGRDWRPLVDTADAAHLLFGARPEGTSWRRSVDFYPEGALVWLEADVIIRERTDGARSLDDFCQKFFGGESGPPEVRTYALQDVVSALNEVVEFDWAAFFRERVYAVHRHSPIGGIERGGWRVVYDGTPSEVFKQIEAASKAMDLTFSVGLKIGEGGGIVDVLPGSAAAKAGVAPAMKLIGVNGRRWTPDLMRASLKSARDTASPIELLVETGDMFQTCRLDYHEGERYPHLERVPEKKDRLSAIIETRRR